MARSKAGKQFGELYRAISTDIYKFCRALNFDPTPQQRELFDAVMRAVYGGGGKRIAVKSGQGPGKTTASGIVGGWLLLLNAYTKLILTAPTMRQCQGVWLAEFKQTIRRADPSIQKMFDITGSGVGVLGHKKEDWGAVLITATKAENAQGQHRENMHLIVEEASGVDRAIIEQFKGTLSNPGALFIQIGNPNSRESQFFDCFTTQADVWETFTWNAEETPASAWFDPIRNKEIEDEYGRDSDVYRVRVLGEFPHADPNCVMSSDDLIKVMTGTKGMMKAARINPRVRQFGMDFARFGGDESVIIRRSGNAVVEHWWQARVDPNDVVDKAFAMQIEYGWRNADTMFVADAGGMGQGVMGNFHRANKRVHEFHSQGKPTKIDYANKMTQAWFELAKKVREGTVHLPKDNLLLRQLSTRQYATNTKGKLILESKDDYSKRGHESPDRADGIVLAMWDHAIVSGQVSQMGRGSRKVGVKK